MRNKTLFSLVVLCSSTAALANLPATQDTPLQNDMTNEGVPAPTPGQPMPGDTMPGEPMPGDTMSNSTDVEPSADPTMDGTQPPPNAAY